MTGERRDTDDHTAARPNGAPPLVRRVSPAQWARENLFNTWYNALLTVVFAPLVGWVLYVGARFVLVTGRWEIVEVNLTNFVVGRFPRTELWRPWVGAGIITLVIAVAVGATGRAMRDAAAARGATGGAPWHTAVRRAGPPLLLVAVIAVFVRTPTPLVLLAGVVGLGAAGYVVGRRVPPVRRRWVVALVVVGLMGAYGAMSWFGGVPVGGWGGLLLILFFAVGGISLSFPLGVLLALGRRSNLPTVRLICAVYIELMRGSPLIALLFMGWLLVPFFLPPGFPIPSVPWRALIIFVLFTAAYVAEIVRGGLQGLPKGQREAAVALGLSQWKVTRLVILPQALRSVIPALVGQFISLFKDTSLASAVLGVTGLLRVATQVTQQPDFLGQGLHLETLVFVSFLWWVGCYWMSRESQRLEGRVGVGER